MPIYAYRGSNGPRYIDDTGREYSADELKARGHAADDSPSFAKSAVDSISNFAAELPDKIELALKHNAYEQLEANYHYYKDSDADRNADLQSAARFLGIAVDTMENADTDIQNDAIRRSKEKVLTSADMENFPILSDMLRDPTLMSQSFDDITALADIEKNGGIFSDAYNLAEATQELNDIDYKAMKGERKLDELDYDTMLRRKQLLARIALLEDRNKKDPFFMFSLGNMLVDTGFDAVKSVTNFADSGDELAATVGSLAIAGSTIAPGAGTAAGAAAGALSYLVWSSAARAGMGAAATQYRNLSTNHNVKDAKTGALTTGILIGALNVPFKSKVLGNYIRQTAEKTGLFKRIGIDVAENFGLGAAMGAAQVVGEKVADGEASFNMNDARTIAQGGMSLAALGGLMSLPGYGWAGVHALGEKVGNSKLAKRNPQAAERLIDTIAKREDGTPFTVSVNAERFYTYLTKLDPQEAQKLYKVFNLTPEKLKYLVETDGDVSATLGQVLTQIDHTHTDALAEDIKTNGQMSFRELVEQIENSEAYANLKADDLLRKDEGDTAADLAETKREIEAEIDADVEAEVNADRLYLATNLLEGKPDMEHQPNGLQFDLQRFGFKEAKATAQDYVDGKLTPEAVDAMDAIAKEYGFQSAAELANAVLNNPTKEQAKATRKQKRLNEELTKIGLTDRQMTLDFTDERRKVNDENTQTAATEAARLDNEIANAERNAHLDELEAADAAETPEVLDEADRIAAQYEAIAKESEGKISQEAYEKVYVPVLKALEEAGPKVAGAAKESAMLIAKQAEMLHKRFGVAYEDAPRVIANSHKKDVNALKQGENAGDAEARLAEDEKQWADGIDHLSGQKGQSIRVMQTPLSMQLVGVKNLPIYMKVSKLKTVLNDHVEMTPDVLKKIPRALTDPVMILQSDTKEGRIVVLLDLKGTDQVQVVVPFELDITKNAINMNLITSAYTRAIEENGKRVLDREWIQRQVNVGKLLYVNRLKAPEVLGMNKEKAMRFLSPAGVQFPMGGKQRGLLSIKIPDEGDLVKSRQENPGYYQKGKQAIAGQFEKVHNLIRIFSKGNASTAIHESGHWYLSTLDNLLHAEAEKRGITGTTAELLTALEKDDTMPKGLVAELKQIHEWGKYSPEALKEYEGTALEKEFAGYAKDIENGVEGAEERFIQERFARGFERYLATGEAPTKALKSAFQRFRDWLIEIYQSVQNLGQKDPPKEIKEIFDRMVSEGGKQTKIEKLRGRIQELKAKQKEIKADLKEQNKEKVEALNAEYKGIISELRKEIKDSDEKRAARRGDIKKSEAKKAAQENLSVMPIQEATDWRGFLKRADDLRRKADVLYARAMNKTPDAFAADNVKADKQSLLAQAARMKNKELRLRAMARESLRVREAVSKLEREFKRDVKAIKNDPTRANRGGYTATKTDESYNAVGSLLEKFGILQEGAWTKQPSIDADFAAYVKRMNDNLGIMRIPDWILKTMEQDGTIDWQRMNLSMAVDVSNALKNIKQAANLENKMLSGERRETVSATRDALMAELGSVEKKDWRNEKKNILKNLWRDQFTFDTIISNLFGDNSKMHDIFIKRKWALDNKERAWVQKYDSMYRAIWDKYTTSEQKKINSHKIFIEELGIDLTKRQLMTIALNMGNEGNIAKLFPQDKTKIPIDVQTVAPERWNVANVTRALENNLDAKDWETVQGIWNLLDAMTPDLVAHEKARTGFTPEMVYGTPFTVRLKDGTELKMSGGYYPLSPDIRSGTMLAQTAEADTLADMLNRPKGLSSTNHGFMKQRTSAEYEVSLDPSLLARHIRNVGHDLFFRDYVSDLSRIVNSQDFEVAVKDAFGMHGRKTMGAYLNQIIGDAYFDASYDAAYQAASYLRRCMATNAIALNFRVIVQNLANLPLYVGAVDGFGVGNMIHAIGTYGLPYWTRTLFDWRGHEKYLQENLSPFMLELFRQPDTTFRNLDTMTQRSDKALTGVLGDVSSAVADFSAHLMWMTDSFASVPMWLEMYHKTLAETGDKAAAMEKADMLVRRVNGSANKADQSLFIRDDKHFYSFMNMFMGFFNTEFNRWAREVSRFTDKPIQATPRMLAFAASRLILFNLASELLMGEGPEEDESWGRWALRKGITYPLTLSWMTKDIGQGAINSYFDAPTMPYRGSAVLQPFNAAAQAWQAVGDFSKDPTTEHAERTAQSVTGAAMYFAQLPKWMWSLFWNAYDWEMNDMSFRASDLFVRRPRNERRE